MRRKDPWRQITVETVAAETAFVKVVVAVGFEVGRVVLIEFASGTVAELAILTLAAHRVRVEGQPTSKQ